MMLQQTQVKTVIPYYLRFLKKFPTVQQLAQASDTTVLDVWSGLGYYTRARNLHAMAREVASQHGGKIPDTVEGLRQLPGIGRYSAGAIVSIAYDRPAAVVDGNVIRVFCRYFGITGNPRESSVLKRIWALADHSVPQRNAGDYNQALMDLGSTLCTPRQPGCPHCPIAAGCVARKKGWQEKIPPVKKPIGRKKIDYLCAIIEKNGSVLVARRPMQSLLPGLWEFPGGVMDEKSTRPHALKQLLRKRLGIQASHFLTVGKQRQVLSHRDLEIEAFRCKAETGKIRLSGYLQTRWIPIDQLQRLPLTAGMKKLAFQLFQKTV
jgi:A/G-specific adenine glycosylase